MNSSKVFFGGTANIIKSTSFELIVSIASIVVSIIFSSIAFLRVSSFRSNPVTFIPFDFAVAAIEEPIRPRPIIKIFSTTS